MSLVFPCSVPEGGSVISIVPPSGPTVTVSRSPIPEEIRGQVSRILDDSAFTDEDIDEWIRDACVHISTQTLGVEYAGFIKLTPALEYFSLSGAPDMTKTPAEFPAAKHTLSQNGRGAQVVRIYSCLYSEGIKTLIDTDTYRFTKYKGLKQAQPRMMGHIGKDEGPPEFYYHFGPCIAFYPTFSQIIDVPENAHVMVYYAAIVDEPEDLPDVLQPLIVDFACYRAKEKEKKYSDAATFYNQYMNLVTQYRYDIWERPSDSKEMFQVPDRQVVVGQ